MARDKQHEPNDRNDASESMHAADEPTAVWDVEALRKAGLEALLDRPESSPPGPATPAEGRERPSIIVEAEKAPDAHTPVAPVVAKRLPNPAARTGNARWVGMIALALLLGGGAFFLIRLLR